MYFCKLFSRVNKVDYVAQQVEHIPFKDGVLGSSPSVVTKNKVDYVAQQVEHIPFKDGVLGSSPSVVTKKRRGLPLRFLYPLIEEILTYM